MVHLTINNRPICESQNIRCQYNTRREAFDAITRYRLSDLTAITIGRCPNTWKGKAS